MKKRESGRTVTKIRKKRPLSITTKPPEKCSPMTVTERFSSAQIAAARKTADKLKEHFAWTRAAEKIVRKVNRAAYEFRPDVLLVVGVDIDHGRVVVKEAKSITDDPRAAHRSAEFRKTVAVAAHLFCSEERSWRMLTRPCGHPRYRMRKKRILLNVTSRGTEEWSYKKHPFCTKCGARLDAEIPTVDAPAAVFENTPRVAARPPKRRVLELL